MPIITALASGYTGLSGFKAPSNIQNAYTDTQSTTYARISTSKKNSTSTIYFNGFDFSDIPDNATINSVTVITNLKAYNKSYVKTATIQGCIGNNPVGDIVNCSYSNRIDVPLRITDAYSFTRYELDQLRVLYSVVPTSNINSLTSAGLDIYGIEVTVDYDVPVDIKKPLLTKINGQWKTVQSVYKKINGQWVEQNDLQSIFDTNANYVRG